ncbi:MAG: ABC transporter ATP-binding protein [Clostridia bacterium]|nr:ABC transporter ATP-binding protein [Clostridia bacterium]
MKRLATFLSPYRKECVLGPLFKLLEALFELIVPLIIAQLVDQAIPSGETGAIIRSGLMLALLALIGLAASVTAQYFAAKAAIGFSTSLRHAVFAHIHSLSYKDLDHLGSATLVTRLTGDINQVQTGMNLGLRLLLRSPFVVFGAMIMAFVIDGRLALIFVGVIAVLFLIVFGIILGTMPMQQQVRTDTDSVSAVTRENLSGVRVIRAFRREASETERFDRLNEILTKAQLHVGRFTAALNPSTYVALNLAILLLLRSGALRVDSGTLTQGQLIALYNYMSQILVELVKLANLIVTLTKSAACAKRISGVLDIQSSQRDGDKALTAADLTSLTFRDAGISYHSSGDAALEHISFTAHPGETIGVIGGTGSGKSTLVNLIPRFYDHTFGEILYGSTPIQQLTLASLRGAIGVVPQHATLFQGTIRSNLLWGNPAATDQELWEALEIAQAAEIVRGKGAGLEEPVQQGGKNFSGGQRQRLTIARALVRKPAILILDDSASALDYATDAALRHALREMPNPPLTFIVSQRTSSVRYADQILVLEDGLCVGQGTHEELFQSCPVYREIHEASAGKEESSHG